jgi:hypothetical protein
VVVLERQILGSFPQKHLAHIKELLEILLNRPQLRSVSRIYTALELVEKMQIHFDLLRIGEYKASEPVLDGIISLFLEFCYSSILKIKGFLFLIRKEVYFLTQYQRLLEQMDLTKKALKAMLYSHPKF